MTVDLSCPAVIQWPGADQSAAEAITLVMCIDITIKDWRLHYLTLLK